MEAHRVGSPPEAGPSKPSGFLSLVRARSRPRNTSSTARPEGLASPPMSTRALSPPPAQAQPTPISRRVRTVPPSAAFDPPSPEDAAAPNPSLPPPSDATNAVSPDYARRRGHWRRIHYDTDSSSAGTSDSEDDPPWWTFTQTGMNKMRARNMRKRPSDSRPNGVGVGGPEGAGVRAGSKTLLDKVGPLEAVKMDRAGASSQSRKRRFTRTNSSRRDSDESVTPTGPGPTPGPTESRYRARFLPPTALRLNSQLQPFWRKREDSAGAPAAVDSTAGHRRARSNSAPTSPIFSLEPLTTILSHEQLRSSPAPTPPQHTTSPIAVAMHPSLSLTGNGPIEMRTESDPIPLGPTRPIVAKRQATAPAFPRLRRRAEEPATDTEVTTRMTRRRGRTLNPAILGPAPDTDHSDVAGSGDATPAGTEASSRPMHGRRTTTRMRLNLPPPVSLHFRDNWPHAGSWQDALYGYYDEESEGGKEGYRASRMRQNSKSTDRPGKRASVGSNKFPTSGTPNDAVPSLPASGSNTPADPSTPKNGTSPRRTKPRKHRRYRQALVPPTPAGLGFTAQERGEVLGPQAGFFDHVAAGAPGGAELNLAASPGFRGGESVVPIDTRTTATVTATAPGSGRTSHENEKLGSGFVREPVKRHWWTRKTPSRVRRAATQEPGTAALWRKRLRRVVFLDARVTIYIRLLNLAVVLACLGLAVTIRIDLDRLRLPGLVGPSTTVNIAYSALTSLHVLLAIYREYFGRPIGLWDLRSKMLWVCLDLLFVALWSSSVSLSSNDFSGTPLQCTKGSPWWRAGLGEEYAKLLDEIEAEYGGPEVEMVLSGLKGTRDRVALLGRASAINITPAEMIQHTLGVVLPDSILSDPLVHDVCRRQAGTIALSLVALLLYGGNMVLSLFRIFETIKRTANVGRAVMV